MEKIKKENHKPEETLDEEAREFEKVIEQILIEEEGLKSRSIHDYT